jgi:DNA-binding winged helix-turn-helix (wHTH) protein
MGHEAVKDAIYTFGPFRLEGKEVDLDETPTQVLLALVEQAGELVSKEDLLKNVWGATAVTDNSFYQHISVLRRTLGEVRKDNNYIMTIPRKGYRFVAPVEIVPTTKRGPSIAHADEIAGEHAGAEIGDSIVVFCEDDAHLVDGWGTVIQVGDTIMLDSVDEDGNSCPSTGRVVRACTSSKDLLVTDDAGYVVGILKLDGGNFFVESDAMADPDTMVKVTVVGGAGKIPGAPVVDGTGKVLTVPCLPATQRAFVIPKDLMKKT